MHTVYVFGGDLGGEEMLVRTDLCDPTASIEINHCDGEGWQDSGHQSAETMGKEWRLREVAQFLAAEACHWGEERFQCSTKQAEHALPWRRLCQLGVVSGELAEVGKVIASDDKLSGGNTYDVALDWMSQGFSAADVAGWTEIGCWDAWTAKELADAGLTPGQAMEAADAVCEHADHGSPIGLIDEICNGDVSIKALLDQHADGIDQADRPDDDLFGEVVAEERIDSDTGDRWTVLRLARAVVDGVEWFAVQEECHDDRSYVDYQLDASNERDEEGARREFAALVATVWGRFKYTS